MNDKIVNKKITLLGSSGSVGRQTLETIEYAGHKVFAIVGKENIAELEAQARRYHPVYCAVYDEKKARELKVSLRDTDVKVLPREGIESVVSDERVTLVVNAISGQIGIKPTLAAIAAKKDVAIANKESLVTAGDIIMRGVRKNKIALYPIDSEHSAIMQCLAGEKKNFIKTLILTATGGPFYGIKDKERLASMTVEETLNHPVWKNMGRKISVDSATMMNKGLELIEACHLFTILPDNIRVLIHRQAVVHSMVEFCDNSIKAQMAVPDMKLCISYAIEGARRKMGLTPRLDLTSQGALTFEKPDDDNFPLIEFARKTMKDGGILPAVMNTANEIAVGKFLRGEIKFGDISNFVINVTSKHNNIDMSEKEKMTLDDVDNAIEEVYGRYS